MLEIVRQQPVRASLLFVILIMCLIVSACGSHRAAPVTEKSRSTQSRPATHTVIPGDTLFSIAWRYGLKYEELARYNGISAPYTIRPSQIIRLSAGSSNTRSASNLKGVQSVSPNTIPKQPNTRVNARPENKTTKPTQSPKPAVNSAAPQWRWPAKGSILSSFQGNNGLNKGIDLSGKLGEPVLAAASGVVVYAGSGLRGYGKLLIIKHNETFLSAYAHNERLRVKEGDLVKVGQVIADMGSSGTDRVKLHFEIRRDGTPVDPLKYLPRR